MNVGNPYRHRHPSSPSQGRSQPAAGKPKLLMANPRRIPATVAADTYFTYRSSDQSTTADCSHSAQAGQARSDGDHSSRDRKKNIFCLAHPSYGDPLIQGYSLAMDIRQCKSQST